MAGAPARIGPEFEPACAPAQAPVEALAFAAEPAPPAKPAQPNKSAQPNQPPRRRFKLKTAFFAIFGTHFSKSGFRIRLTAVAFGSLFLLFIGRLAYLGTKPDPESLRREASQAVSAARPEIVDRNGQLLAMDVKVMSVFADPREIIDKDEATEELTAILPDLNAHDLRARLGARKGFVWIKRDISPSQQQAIFRLGLPGVGFLPENKRVYPNGPLAAHVLGFTNPDNQGIAGVEKYLDGQGLSDLHDAGFKLTQENLAPVALSLDMRATHARARRTRSGDGKLFGQSGRRRDYGREHRRSAGRSLAARLRSGQSGRRAQAQSRSTSSRSASMKWARPSRR